MYSEGELGMEDNTDDAPETVQVPAEIVAVGCFRMPVKEVNV